MEARALIPSNIVLLLDNIIENVNVTTMQCGKSFINYCPFLRSSYVDFLRILGRTYERVKARDNIAAMNDVMTPRMMLPVNIYPETIIPNATVPETTSKALLTLLSFLQDVRKAEALAAVMDNPITVVATFSERKPLRNKSKPKVPQTT